MAKPTQADILKLGAPVARLKASMPSGRWRAFVKGAHAAGHTVAGQLSGVPDPLKERTQSSLRNEATRTVATSYKPVVAELDRRTAAAGFLDQKRQADDAAYRTWMSGELGKLDAQARAADTTLLTTQHDIATGMSAAQQAAQADSLSRVAQQPGNVSNPQQSTALDYKAADQHSTDMVAAAREHTAQISKIGADAEQLSHAAVIATAATREAAGAAEHWKTLAGINADRATAGINQAHDTTDLLTRMRADQVANAKTNIENDLAAGSLNVKRDSITADAEAAAHKYNLDRRQFKLDQWKAQNADKVAQAKVQLGYDQIASREGQHAATAALDKWIETHKEKAAANRAAGKNGKGGVTPDERKLYGQVETMRSTIINMRAHGWAGNHGPKTDHQIRQHLIAAGGGSVMFDVANDLTQSNNMGVLSAHGVAKAKRLGIQHTGYFWS